MASVWSYVVFATFFCLGSATVGLSSVESNPLFVGLDEKARNDLEYVHRRLQEFGHQEDSATGYGNEGEALESSGTSKRPRTIPEINRPYSDYLYQGDITLTPDQVDQLLSSRSKRQAINVHNPNFSRWPTDAHGSIAYYMVGFNLTTKNVIRKAIKFWETHTCVTFQENGPERPIIRIQDSGEEGMCNSAIGKVNGDEQIINLSRYCLNFGLITHEVGHALGFFHEHTRHDRDSFITIRESNVLGDKPFFEINFKTHPFFENDNQGIPFDYGSIMHYDRYAFALNPLESVMEPTQGYELFKETMGQSIKPSFLDLKMMNKLYQCEYKCQGRNTACHNGGFMNPKNCNECICPWGFSAKDCWERDPGRNGTDSSKCGGNLWADSTSRVLEADVGVPIANDVLNELHDSCHWHIHTAEGKRVRIHIEKLESWASRSSWYRYNAGCTVNNVEFKMAKDVSKTGYRLCISGNFTQTPEYLWSEGNRAIVSAYARGVQRFRISYQAI
ncbi:hypothetical protein QR680_004405 [Steinernema hermaphroditum]|uniref:Zinc metalloproteinase n=1 Tax=Steinernema hermaphroditum TaxID=289476 RepID=A0AA39HQ08_9BILA|nr:hypothetical protein QR680_004405 [Steinernema hermaphroditum]